MEDNDNNVLAMSATMHANRFVQQAKQTTLQILIEQVVGRSLQGTQAHVKNW